MDSDGLVAKYAFYGRYLNDDTNIGLGYSSNGTLQTTLPLGASYDSYKMYIYIEIIDDNDGYIIYNISSPIISQPDLTNANQILEDLIGVNTSANTLKHIFSGNPLQTVQNILLIGNNLNFISQSDKLAIILSGIYYNKIILKITILNLRLKTKVIVLSPFLK